MDDYKKVSLLLVAGVVACAAYQYSRMSRKKKDALWVNMKESGKQLVNKIVPQNVKDRLAKGDSIDNHPSYGRFLPEPLVRL